MSESIKHDPNRFYFGDETDQVPVKPADAPKAPRAFTFDDEPLAAKPPVKEEGRKVKMLNLETDKALSPQEAEALKNELQVLSEDYSYGDEQEKESAKQALLRLTEKIMGYAPNSIANERFIFFWPREVDAYTIFITEDNPDPLQIPIRLGDVIQARADKYKPEDAS